MIYFREWLLSEDASHIKVNLPSVRQGDNYDCGAAILRSVCEYFKVGPEKESEFIKAAKTTKKDGTDTHDLIAAANKFGLFTRAKENMTIRELKQFLDLGRPIICCVQAWDETPQKKSRYKKKQSGHWVAVIGYGNGVIYFEDPVLEGDRGALPYKEWNKRWIDKDSDGKVYDHFGIVIWKAVNQPDEQRMTTAKKVP